MCMFYTRRHCNLILECTLAITTCHTCTVGDSREYCLALNYASIVYILIVINYLSLSSDDLLVQATWPAKKSFKLVCAIWKKAAFRTWERFA